MVIDPNTVGTNDSTSSAARVKFGWSTLQGEFLLTLNPQPEALNQEDRDEIVVTDPVTKKTIECYVDQVCPPNLTFETQDPRGASRNLEPEAPPWRQPRGKLIISLVNSHSTSKW